MIARQCVAIIGLIVSGSFLFTSCIINEDHNATPNNNNNHNGGTTVSYQFNEEFNGADKYGWSFTNASDSAYASITNDAYQYVDYSAVKSNLAVVNTGINTQNNFTASTRIKSNKVMGLIFGASVTSNGYAFYIDTAGSYSLYREGFGFSPSTVVIPTTRDTLYARKNDWNVLQIDQVNNTWSGYINGTRVFTMSAGSLSGGQFGYKVLPGTIGYADYLIIKNN
jgi:hypothetical protein